MAEVLINEIICFVSNHFHSVVAANILTVFNTFYEEDELMKAKADLYEICKKNITDCDIPRIIG